MEPIEKTIAPNINAIKETIEPVNLAPAKILDDDSKSEPRTSKNSNTDSSAKTLIYDKTLNFTNEEKPHRPRLLNPIRLEKVTLVCSPPNYFPQLWNRRVHPNLER